MNHTSKSGLPRYEHLIANWSGEILNPVKTADSANTLYTTDEILFFQDIFFGFTEITSAIEEIDLIEKLISSAPPRSRKISKDQYIKHLISGYLQETYILKERLEEYAKKLHRKYKKIIGNTKQIGKIGELSKLTHESFKGITETRGSHVHSRKYSDDTLNILSSLALISKFKPDYLDDLNAQYTITKIEWQKTIANNKIQTNKLLDVYFNHLHDAITKDNKIITHPTLFKKTELKFTTHQEKQLGTDHD